MERRKGLIRQEAGMGTREGGPEHTAVRECEHPLLV